MIAVSSIGLLSQKKKIRTRLRQHSETRARYFDKQVGHDGKLSIAWPTFLSSVHRAVDVSKPEALIIEVLGNCTCTSLKSVGPH